MKTETNPVIKDLNNKAITTQEVLLLTNKKVKTLPDEVVDLHSKYKKYGINNSTSTLIQEKKDSLINEKLRLESDQAKNTFLTILLNGFVGYKVITYKTLHEICQDYGIYINALSSYNKPIPDEVIPSIDSFVDVLKENRQLFSDRTRFQLNTYSTLQLEKFDKSLVSRYNDDVISMDRMFKIAAPKSHFKKDSYNQVVGQELVNITKPKFTKGLKFNPPKFETKDPIIFLPFRLLQNVYCIIVDAWDEEGNDERIRMMLD